MYDYMTGLIPRNISLGKAIIPEDWAAEPQRLGFHTPFLAGPTTFRLASSSYVITPTRPNSSDPDVRAAGCYHAIIRVLKLVQGRPVFKAMLGNVQGNV